MEVNDASLHERAAVRPECKIQHDVILNGAEARAIAGAFVILQAGKARAVAVHRQSTFWRNLIARLLVDETTAASAEDLENFMMYAFKKLAVISLASVAVTCAFAQTEPTQSEMQRAKQSANQSDETAPQAASSPHQREATSTAATEAPATSDGEPASSSSPHQREATKTANAKSAQKDEMLNNCISKHQKADAKVTKDQAKRTCMDQMKKAEMPAG